MCSGFGAKGLPLAIQLVGKPFREAIVLRINSPGGSPVQAGIINDEIKRLKKLHNKKVYAVVEETCASAAYYIAAATDNDIVKRTRAALA